MTGDSAQAKADAIKAERRAAGTLGRVTPTPTAISVHRGRTLVDVTIDHAPDADTALELALTASGETRPRLFGWTVGDPDDQGRRTVTLHTD